MGYIFYLSSHPVAEIVKWFPIIARLKLVHMVEYGFLYYLYWWALRKTTSFDNTEAFSVAFMLTLIYGLTDEFHQIFVIGRTARLMDAIANMVGAVVVQAGILSARKQ